MASSSCTGGDSFRISGFPLGAFDGCYSASSVSTFNFLPIFYNTAGGVPADGPTVYASDLFGTLSDEHVFAIGWYDQTRDVVDRSCFDAAYTRAASTHPSEIATWDCGGLTSTFTVACGCSTPAPLAAATPSPLVPPTPAPSVAATPTPSQVVTPSPNGSVTPVPTVAANVRVTDTPSPTATGKTAETTPAPSVQMTVTPSSSSSVTPVPTAGATSVVLAADTPSPTAAGTATKPTSAPMVLATPVPTHAPAAAAATTAPLGATPSPTGASRDSASSSAPSTTQTTPVPTTADMPGPTTPAPTTSDTQAPTTPAPTTTTPAPSTAAPIMHAPTTTPAPTTADTPGPFTSAPTTPSPTTPAPTTLAPTAAAQNSTSSPSRVTACSGTDSFRLDGFQADSYDGCFSASVVSTFNSLPVFFIGGTPADGGTVYASDLSGSLANEYFWSIGNYNQSGDFVDTRHCVDADGRDASTIHPSDVTTWTCEGSGIVANSTAFTITCGCSTPDPTPSPFTPPCGGVDSFRLSNFSYQTFDGCYSASDSSTFNFNPIYFVGGEVVDGPAVYASDLFGLLENEYVWSIGSYRRDSDDVDVRHCHDGAGANASTLHPSEVTDWDCGALDSTAFSITCGCATPAPVTTSPASTPSPDDTRGIDVASAAPAAASELAEETTALDAPGVPLVVAIVTGVTIFVVVMIILSIAFEGLRKGIWMCFTCKRESTSQDTLSQSGSVSRHSSRGEHGPPVVALGSTATL